jgi:hypothetical protein
MRQNYLFISKVYAHAIHKMDQIHLKIQGFKPFSSPGKSRMSAVWDFSISRRHMKKRFINVNEHGSPKF